MHKILASLVINQITDQYRDSVIVKLASNKLVKDTRFFQAVIAPTLKVIIAKHDMSKYVLDIELLNVNENGVDTKQLNICKSSACNILTHDLGEGFPDEAFIQKWRAFMKEVIVFLNEHYITTFTGKHFCYVRRLHKPYHTREFYVSYKFIS